MGDRYKLDDCPFCGGTPNMHRFPEDDPYENGGGYAVICTSCGSCGAVHLSCKESGEFPAASAWNRRVAHD